MVWEHEQMVGKSMGMLRFGLCFAVWGALWGVLGVGEGLAQTPPSSCTRPSGASGQQDGGSSGDAYGCIRSAKKLQYGYSSFLKGYLQRLVSIYDDTDVYYYDYGKSVLDVGHFYCVEFRTPSGSPTQINSDVRFRVWQSNYLSSSSIKYVGTVTTTKGVGFYVSAKTRYYYDFYMTRASWGGHYAFKITRDKNCGGQAPLVGLDYEPTAAYKSDTYTGGSGITSTDGKGVALLRSFDRSPLGTGPNVTNKDGDRFSFVVRSSIEPKYSFYLQLYYRDKNQSTWRTKSLVKDALFSAPSGAKYPYRYYYTLTCSSKTGSNNIGRGTDYQYYFKLQHDGKTIYLPPQAAQGQYLDAPDCNLPLPPEPVSEPTPEPVMEPVVDGGSAEQRPEGTVPEPKQDGPAGQCVPACGAGQRCVMGQCVPFDCYVDGCLDGQICRNEKCEADPCANKNCPGGQFCREGKCVGTCVGVSCESAQHCVDGKCINNPCAGVQCPEGEYCNTAGKCASDPCYRKTCPAGRVCVSDHGNCVDDPCNGVSCPGIFASCVMGQCVGRAPKEPNVTESSSEPSEEPVQDNTESVGGQESVSEIQTDGTKTEQTSGVEIVADAGSEKTGDEDRLWDGALGDGLGDGLLGDGVGRPGCGCSVGGDDGGGAFMLLLFVLVGILRKGRRLF